MKEERDPYEEHMAQLFRGLQKVVDDLGEELDEARERAIATGEDQVIFVEPGKYTEEITLCDELTPRPEETEK